MQIVSDYTDFVDYKNSSFVIYQNLMINLGHIQVFSKEDLIEKEEKLKTDNPHTTLAILSEKLKMLPSFDLSLQFFKIGNFDSKIYVGGSLKKILIENQITGCKILDTDKIAFKIKWGQSIFAVPPFYFKAYSFFGSQ